MWIWALPSNIIALFYRVETILPVQTFIFIFIGLLTPRRLWLGNKNVIKIDFKLQSSKIKFLRVSNNVFIASVAFVSSFRIFPVFESLFPPNKKKHFYLFIVEFLFQFRVLCYYRTSLVCIAIEKFFAWASIMWSLSRPTTSCLINFDKKFSTRWGKEMGGGRTRWRWWITLSFTFLSSP